MRQAKILYKNEEAGLLTQDDAGAFTFRYHPTWVADSSKPSISLSFPKVQEAFHSEFLFPFFYHVLPEGSNRQIVCKYNRIDEDDDFGLLMTTARYDNVGAVIVIKIEKT